MCSRNGVCIVPVYSCRQYRLCKGRSMYRYEGNKLGGSTRAHKVYKKGYGTRAHKVHEGCWQVGGTTGTGVFWRYTVPSWGVMWSTCHG